MSHTIVAIVIVMALLCIGGSLCYGLMLRKRLCRFIDGICEAIDNVANGAEVVQLNLQESLSSKINHKLTRLCLIMNENRQQLSREKQELQELISDISHQVKTPIANLKMLGSTLNRSDISKEQKEQLRHSVHTQLDQLDFLMQALVKTSRLETGVIALNCVETPIYETLGMALGAILPSAEKKEMEITVHCDETLMVLHDKKWTAEAIFNLLDNAVKYSESQGGIDVTVAKWEMYTKIDITDKGKGISEEHQAQIWNRFYREEEVAQMEGIGIGLYLTRTIITMQGGYMKVESKPSEGSTFSIFLLNP